MTFAILGDTHFDFHLSANAPVNEHLFDMRFKHFLEASPADVLLLPGDIGHYNAQNLECLKHLRRYYDRSMRGRKTRRGPIGSSTAVRETEHDCPGWPVEIPCQKWTL